jgi:SAM-dependent methyltransferase
MSGDEAHPFTDVDGQADPNRWIGVLDRLSAEPLYRQYKARIIELLAPHADGSYLDVGCGTGAAGRTVANAYGCRVVGLDSSTTMVTEARARGLTEAVVGDAQRMPFDDESFDGAWADRTFQHLDDPAAALRELARVVKDGGVLVVADPDYSTQTLSISDQGLAERVLGFRADHGIRNGTMAHLMADLLNANGLSVVSVEEWPIVLHDLNSLDNALGLRHWAQFAAERGLIDHRDVPRWDHELAATISEGTFRYSFSICITAGRKQPNSLIENSDPGFRGRRTVSQNERP